MRCAPELDSVLAESSAIIAAAQTNFAKHRGNLADVRLPGNVIRIAPFIERATREGAGDPSSFLDNNDSYAFFHALGDLIHTGATGTNVGDLQVILLA